MNLQYDRKTALAQFIMLTERLGIHIAKPGEVNPAGSWYLNESQDPRYTWYRIEELAEQEKIGVAKELDPGPFGYTHWSAHDFIVGMRWLLLNDTRKISLHQKKLMVMRDIISDLLTVRGHEMANWTWHPNTVKGSYFYGECECGASIWVLPILFTDDVNSQSAFVVEHMAKHNCGAVVTGNENNTKNYHQREHISSLGSRDQEHRLINSMKAAANYLELLKE